MEWTAINFKDAMVTRPGNRVARKFPLVPGVELTGIVEESSSAEFSAGDRVLVQGYDLGVAQHGGFAAYARVPADWVVPLPDRLSCRSAAIIGLAGLTALLSLRRLRQHGTTVDDGPILVTGASGGVGSAAKARAIENFGADIVVDYNTQDFVEVVRDATGGADVVLDIIGGEYLQRNLACLRLNGCLVQIGLMSESKSTVDLRPLLQKRRDRS